MAGAKGEKLEFPALTGVRAIAAYMVFFHHMAVYRAGMPFAYYLAAGYTGVSVFFVLSGFLITHNYGGMFQPERPWNLKLYFRKRFARIFPLYWLLLTIFGLSAYASGVTHGPLYWFLAATLLKGFSSTRAFTGIDQSWSLGVEEIFYALAPLFFLLMHRGRLFWGLLGAIAAAIVWIACRFLLFEQMDWTEKAMFVIAYTFPGRALEFFVGIQLSRIVRAGSLRTEVKKFRGWLTSAAALMVLACILWINSINQSESGKFPVAATFLHQLILPFPIALFFLGLIKEDSWIRRILASRLFQLLGASSYAFYLLHDGVLANRIGEILRGIPVARAHYVTSLFLCINAVSVLIYKGFEDPVRRWINPRSTFTDKSGGGEGIE